MRMRYEEQLELEQAKKKEEKEAERRPKRESVDKAKPNFMKATAGAGRPKRHKEDNGIQATAATAILPNDTIVYLMNNDLYFSPTEEHTPCSWVKAIAMDVLNRACEDAGRIRYLSKAVGNNKVYDWMEKVLTLYLDKDAWVKSMVKEKRRERKRRRQRRRRSWGGAESLLWCVRVCAYGCVLFCFVVI